MTNVLLLWVLLSGCVRTVPVSPVVSAPVESALVLEQVRQLPLPASGKIQIQVKGSSKALNFAGSVGGVLLFDRPEAASMKLVAPFIGPVFSATYDGEALSVLTYSNAEQRYADRPDLWVAQATNGALTVDEAFGLLIGDLPMKEVLPLSVVGNPDGTTVATWRDADGQTMVATIGSTGFLQRVVVLASDTTLVLSMTYGEYAQADKVWMPKSVTLEIPKLTLKMTITYRGALANLPKSVRWNTEIPTGFTRKELPPKN
jgi:hypothetical protein